VKAGATKRLSRDPGSIGPKWRRKKQNKKGVDPEGEGQKKRDNIWN